MLDVLLVQMWARVGVSWGQGIRGGLVVMGVGDGVVLVVNGADCLMAELAPAQLFTQHGVKACPAE